MRRLALVLALACAFGARGEPTEEEGSADPDYGSGRKAVEAQQWPAAIRLLGSAALRDTRNSDIQNLLGFAYRNAGDLAAAFKHYNRALQLNPRHRGAHQYLGEAYLMAGNLAKAEEHLAALERICLIPCEERGQLARKLAEYRQRRP
jgi:Flp pilus assembly protein TadD